MARSSRNGSGTDFVICRHCRRRYRAITVRHLRRIHDYDGEHPIQEYKQRFRLKTATCRTVRRHISEEKSSYWSRRGQGWTSEKVLRTIRQLRRSGTKLSSKRLPARLSLAARRYFGSWQRAIEQAGFDYEKETGVRRWNREKVLDQIRNLAAAGVPLHAGHIKRRHHYLYRAAVKAFPSSWAKALRAAGYDPAEHLMPRGRWNRAKAEQWVRNRLTRRQPILAVNAPSDLVRFVHARLRVGWIEFVESLGIPYPGVKKRRDWSRTKVISEMQRWAAAGNRMNYRGVMESYQALLQQAKKYFGTWDRARRVAGV